MSNPTIIVTVSCRLKVGLDTYTIFRIFCEQALRLWLLGVHTVLAEILTAQSVVKTEVPTVGEAF